MLGEMNRDLGIGFLPFYTALLSIPPAGLSVVCKSMQGGVYAHVQAGNRVAG